MSNGEQVKEEEKQENQREEQEQIQVKKQEQVQLKQEQQASLHEQQGCTAAEVLVKCLEKEGVEYVFGIPGEENLDMMNALEKSNIRVIVVRHEQGAAFMADMYGRLTGKAGVCFSTLGPGATNLITGTADANSDGAPLIAITGQVGTERMHLTSHQYLDLVELVCSNYEAEQADCESGFGQ